MHDYQLERLNTRSFEQLIQALGTEILGPQLMIFGDGPDGGREATFDGTVNYPSAKKWNGYGIVQAKFRQQPDSEAKKNGDWAIQQLAAEFKKLKPRPRPRGGSSSKDRICPEYYIFATNVSLSPVAKRGGKDRVRAVLNGYKESHGLKGYAIWDGDQIRRFLDAHPGIRTTYTAWLLPGDVLAEMVKILSLERTDFLSTIRRYLESELLDDQFARLGQGGYTDAKNIPLCSVFVDLPVDLPDLPRVRPDEGSFRRLGGPDNGRMGDKSNKEEQCKFLQLFIEEGTQVLKPSVTKKGSCGRIVLIGGPGQGKTTLGQYACQLFRAELVRASGGPFSPEISQALQRIDDMSEELPPVRARRYPLRVDLKHLAASLASTAETGSNNLFDYLIKRIATRTNTTVRAQEFRRWLVAYPWVLVLDGLDEVPVSSNRQQVMQAIRDFISVEAHSVDADLLVLATTRPQGYSDEFDPSLYRHMPLAPLEAREALGYAERLAKARHPGQHIRIEELVSALGKATRNPATVRLMQSPLQVTIMLALIEGGGEPPEQRWKLFHDYYDVIFRREKERGTPFSAILGRYEPDIHWIHHRAGWLLQRRNAEPGTTNARLTHEEFEKMVDDRLQASGHEDAAKRNALVTAIRVAATDRLVLLVGNTAQEIGFEIRSLQEFMAAEHFFDGEESCVQRTLHAIAAYPYWRNVFLFAAGRVFFERQVLIDSIIAVCVKMNEDPTDEAERKIFGGSRLALALLKDGAARNQPASIRVIARRAARALEACDDEVGVSFAEAFSGEAEEVWKEELTKRLKTSGSSFLQHNWLLCLQLVEKGRPWAHALMMELFPWKKDEALNLIVYANRAGNRVPDAFWSEVAQNVFDYPLSLFMGMFRHEDMMPAPLRRGPLNRFLPLFDALHQEADRWPIRDLPGFAFQVRGSKSLKFWAALSFPEARIQNSHPEWLILRATCAFAQNPTCANLSEQLSLISQPEVDSTPHIRWRLPWQIAVCLAAKAAGIAWNEIIQSVTSGSLGDQADWLRWERQNSAGIPLSRFRIAGALIVSDERQGTMLRESGWSFGATEDEVHILADKLSVALNEWPDIRSQYRLLEVCAFGLNNQRFASASRAGALARFIAACAAHRVQISHSIISAVLQGVLTTSDQLDLLGKVGTCPIQEDWLPDWESSAPEINEQLNVTLNYLHDYSERLNVLRAISFLPPLDALRRIPQILIEELYRKGGDYSKAATALRINRFQWNEHEAIDLVGKALALREDYLERLIDFVESTGISGPLLEAFFVELLKQPHTILDARMFNRATSTLVKLVERRPVTGTLPDPSIRSRASRF